MSLFKTKDYRKPKFVKTVYRCEKKKKIEENIKHRKHNQKYKKSF